MKQVQYVEQYLTIKEVVEKTRFSRATIYRLIKQGKFPAQRKIGASARWAASEVHEWMARQPTSLQGYVPAKKRVRIPKNIRKKLQKKKE